MRDFDYPSPGSQPFDAPYPSPDSSQHLDHIRDELRNDHLEPPKFYGVDLGVLRIGFTSDGAFNPAINLGIAQAQLKVGLVNGAEAGVNLGPIVQAGAGAYAGFDENGIFGQAKLGGEALTIVGATGHADARFGNATGIDGGTSAHLGPIAGRAGAGAALGQDGLDATVSGHARIGELANAHAGGHLGLNKDSQIGAAVGAGIGEAGATAGAGVFSDGNAMVRPDIYVQGRAGQDYGSAHLVPPGGYSYDDAYTAQSIDVAPLNDGGRSATVKPISEAPPTPITTSDAPPPASASSLAPEVAQASAVPPMPEIEMHPLPKAATAEQVARMDKIFRTVECREATYVVAKGDTYESIAKKLMPDADDINLVVEARKLQELHESGGFHSLKPGQHIATKSADEIDLKTRQWVATYFDRPVPQS